MVYLIFASALAFLAFLIWYLASPDFNTRRVAGLASILAALATCVLSMYPLTQTIKLGLDLKGGTSFLVELQGTPSPSAVQQAIGVIRKRIDPNGVRELGIQSVSSNRINVQIPGLAEGDREEAARQLSRVAKLEFRMVHPDSSSILKQVDPATGKLPVQYALEYEVLKLQDRAKDGKVYFEPIVVKRVAELSGKHVSRAFRSGDQLGRPEVVIQFDSEGQKRFGAVTEANIGQRLAIVLDNEVKSAPVIRARITDNATISGGNMSLIESEELASVLENPLETPVAIKEIRGVDPTLGRDSIQSGRDAALYALIGVCAFMVIYYRLAGLVAVVSLAVNLVILLGLMAQFHFTLSLPGIAGIVLTIGMAVDANVLIYERIRDELAQGKPLRTAIDLGFNRAFSAIFDSNITTVIPAVVLMFLGTGPLRGFAVTLTLGIVANLFAALVVSRNCFDWMLTFNKLKGLTMMQFLHSPKFDFLRYRHIGVIASVVILIWGGIAFQTKGDKLLGVDFKGGDSVTLKYETMAPMEDVRAALQKAGVDVSQLQYSPEAHVLMVQTPEGQGNKAEDVIKSTFASSKFTHGGLDRVGPAVGDELRTRAILALSIGLIGILIYSAVRFEWTYAVAAAIGQLHDVLIALGFMAILDRELTLTLVGAFLTIAGYSINDKIVVFDRIREGTHLREKGTFYEVINRSLNLTLARTLLTGGTTLIATTALILFGGPVIHDFSVAMLIGILSGIYSSHFISPPLAWWLEHYKEKNTAKLRKAAPTAA
ncbi:MAG: protein translocase subunit SecDF [Verrucomicrobia bacterium Tous-C9LFEB]|nr:MAG: protein translocase subunit SecDF [Verrucomicrobia bacterium Tous-C9LFEB]